MFHQVLYKFKLKLKVTFETKEHWFIQTLFAKSKEPSQ
jgi:hypothetical protein